MKNRAIYLLCGLLAVTGAASADTRTPPKPRSVSASHQAHNKPTPASSFAPHPGRAGQHVYGAPIQAPILKMQPKKPAPGAPKVS
jgi:hypothetical protein